MRYRGRAARMSRHHKRHKKGTVLNLVSLMDIFTILVFFLLVNSGDVETMPSTRDVQLPESIAEQKARENVVVLVTERDLLVQGRRIGGLDELLAGDEAVIPELKSALEAQTERALRQASADEAADREVTIMGDREIPYRILKRIMATCTEADYGRLSLAVLQKTSGAQIAAASVGAASSRD